MRVIRNNEFRPVKEASMRDIAKTLSYGTLHIISGFTIAYLLTGSVAVAGGIALLEPVANTVVFYLHEKVWKRIPEERPQTQPRAAAALL